MNVNSPTRATNAPTPAQNGRQNSSPAEEIPWDSVPEDETQIGYSAGTVYELHPAGIFEAEFVGFIAFTDEKYGKTRLRLHFLTEHAREDGEPSRLGCYTAPNLDSRAKLRSFLSALGEDLDEVAKQMADGSFRLADRVGGRVRVVVEHQARSDGQGDNAIIKSFASLENRPANRRARWGK